MRRVSGDFGRKGSGGGSTSSGGPPYKKPASTKQRAGNSEHAASEQAASEHAAPSTEQEQEASSEKRPGTACEQGQRETKRQRETKWWSPRSEWLLPTREQELANRLGIDSCFKCKGKEWELVKSCDDCGELICADCDNQIRRVSGDPVRMESIFSFQAGGAGGGSPRISFFKKIFFNDAFVNISTA